MAIFCAPLAGRLDVRLMPLMGDFYSPEIAAAVAINVSLGHPDGRAQHYDVLLTASRNSGILCAILDYSLVARRRSELAITVTELRLIAALASMGVTSPNAAKGKLRAL